MGRCCEPITHSCLVHLARVDCLATWLIAVIVLSLCATGELSNSSAPSEWLNCLAHCTGDWCSVGLCCLHTMTYKSPGVVGYIS